MILAFDLDDTLYCERSYVESGLRAVAALGEERFGWDSETSFRFMLDILEREGRGAIFDRWLQSHGHRSNRLIAECVRHYRHHRPRLALDPHAAALLPLLSDLPLYLVTDGHKIVQQIKVEALGITPFFRRVFITHRFGRHRAKPSAYCFERILATEGSDWRDLVYVGDNPAKDFVTLNARGAHTVRVLTGEHRNVKAAPGYDAAHRIEHLGHLREILPHLSSDREVSL